MEMTDRDANRLELILQLIADIERRLATMTIEMFLADRDERDLTAYRLATIGEETRQLSDALKNRHDLPWIQIYGMRNVVFHDYVSVDPDLIWGVAKSRLAALEAMCRAELDQHPS